MNSPEQVIRKVMHPEKTKWARRYKQNDKSTFDEALRLVKKLNSVTIAQRDDHSFKGDYLWAITPNNAPDFWLDALPSLDEATVLCRIMGWPVKHVHQSEHV